MGKEIEKEPDFYPFRIKDHGWVLKKGVSTETIGEAFKDMVYELVTKDFTPGSIAESMHNDALTMIDERAAKARKAAKTRWQKAQGNQLTADGDTREDSLNMTTVRKNGTLESGTSANLYGGAATRESEDDSTTVSKNMRRVPQNEAPAHGFSGGRAAQGTMSRPPEAAAQSGKAYDQETASGNYQRRAGGHLLPSSSLNGSPARSGAVDVLNLAYAGEFGNVRLTQEQYAQLGIKFGNQQKLNRAIDSLSCQLENGEKNPANHYAELVKWASYRDDMEEKEELRASGAPHYETVSEHNARVLAAGKKWIDEHFPKKDNKHG